MNGQIRAILTVLAAGGGGVLLWLAADFDKTGTGGYWAALGVIAGAGLLLGLVQALGRRGDPRLMLLVFALVAIAGLWVIVAGQPDANATRDHVRAWDGDIGITSGVDHLAVYVPVIAYALGAIFGFVFAPLRRQAVVLEPATAPAAVDEPALEEPTLAERREAETAAADGRTRLPLVP
jgi:hypothetical protein